MKNKLENRIWENIKRRRMNLGLSRADVAKAIGITVKQLDKYEKAIYQ